MKRHRSLRSLRILGAALFDARTPAWLKAFIAFAAIYGISPLDLIPDIIPLGLLDDLLLFITALVTFLTKTKTIRRDLRGSV